MIFTRLRDRRLLSVSGQDSFRLLQGLVSNDMSILDNCRRTLLKALFLGSDGRIQSDGIISRDNEGYLVETGSGNLAVLLNLLKRRKLGAKVQCSVPDNRHVYGSVPVWLIHKLKLNGPMEQTSADVDTSAFEYSCDTPFLRRIYSQSPLTTFVRDYDAAYRVYMALNGFALPLVSEIKPLKVLAQDMKLHQLGFVAQNKGCYVGQEIMNRILNRTLINKYELMFLIRSDICHTVEGDHNVDEMSARIMELKLVKAMAGDIGEKKAVAVIQSVLNHNIQEIPQVDTEGNIIPIVYYSTGFGLALCPKRLLASAYVAINGMQHTIYSA